MSTVPSRRTSEMALNQWNQAFRASPLYQQWMATHGKVDTGRGVQLSDQERDQFTRDMMAAGIALPGGMKFDHAGNLNQKNTLGRNLAIGAAIGAGTLTGFGLAGMGPLSGLGGGAAAAGSGMGAIPLGYGLTPALVAENAAMGGVSLATLMGTGGAGVVNGASKKLKDLLTGGSRSWLQNDGLLSLISGLTNGGLQLWGAKTEADSNDRSAELQAKAAADALAYMKELEARDRAQYLEERERDWRLTDEARTRQWGREDEARNREWGLHDARLARLAPFQANGAKAYNRLSSLLLG